MKRGTRITMRRGRLQETKATPERILVCKKCGKPFNAKECMAAGSYRRRYCERCYVMPGRRQTDDPDAIAERLREVQAEKEGQPDWMKYGHPRPRWRPPHGKFVTD